MILLQTYQPSIGCLIDVGDQIESPLRALIVFRVNLVEQILHPLDVRRLPRHEFDGFLVVLQPLELRRDRIADLDDLLQTRIV